MNGYKVSGISYGSFSDCSDIISITIPDSVTSIGRGAFKYCQSLANIKIPEKVTEIGSEAFIYTDLTEIIIPESVASIGSKAFPSSDGFTVYGYKGTAAQEYAEKYGLIFLTVPEKNKKFIDSATGVAVSGTLSDDLVLSVEKIDDYDNDNILCEYKISLITPDNVVFKNHKSVEVSIPGDELECKVLSIDDDGVYHFVNSEYADGYYVTNTDSLSTYALSKALSVGEVISLDGMVSAFDTDNINWNSSDNGIARVSANGTLTAVNPGVVTITATDDSGKYTAEETFTVAGDKFALPEYDLISLDNGEIEYTSSSVECKQIPCEQLNGIYFLKRNELSFYSLTNNKQRHIFTFDGCTNAYSANDNLYVVYKDKIRVYDLLSQKITSEINLPDYKGNAVGADSYTYALPINSTVDDNETGVSVGGFELSYDNCLIVGNTVDQSNSNTYDVYGQRNIFLTVTKKSLNDTNKIMLTNYTEDDNIKPRTPQLVKLDDDHFLIMWEEYNQSTGEIKVKMVTVDGDGTITSDIVTKNIRLSDCQPIVTKDGLVKWYTTNGNEVTMYTVNPYDFKIVGDVNGDGVISVTDATVIQKYIVGLVTKLG